MLLILLFVSFNTYSQSLEEYYENSNNYGSESTYYYDLDMKESSKEKAKIIKIINSSGEVYDYDKKGNLLTFYEKAVIVNKSDDFDSIYEGIVIYYYKSGRINYEVNLVNLPEGNLEEGEYKFYTKSGKLYIKSNFIGGSLNGKHIIYTKFGSEERNFKNGEPYGNLTYFTKSNIKVAEGNISDGADWVYFNKSGEIISRNWYDFSKIKKLLRKYK